jgi:hypothetical protein
MAECSAQPRSNNFAACEAAMTISTLEADIAGSDVDDPGEPRKLAAWYREFADRAGGPWIWEARSMTAEALEREAGRWGKTGRTKAKRVSA